MKKHWGKNISSKKIQKMSNSTNWFLLKKFEKNGFSDEIFTICCRFQFGKTVSNVSDLK